MPTLKVISRTSAMHYKGSTAPLRQIAGDLGVPHVLELPVKPGVTKADSAFAGVLRRRGQETRASQMTGPA